MNKQTLRRMVGGGLFAAIIVVLQLIGGGIRFGTFSISLVLVPIVVGTAVYGWQMGGWLGLVFGAAVLLSGDANLFMTINPAGTIATVLIKGIACGLAAGGCYTALHEKHPTLATVAGTTRPGSSPPWRGHAPRRCRSCPSRARGGSRACRAQFAREGFAGVTAARESFQTVAFLAQEGGYAVLPRWSRDMCAVSALVRRWKEEPPAPYSGREEDRDPCFPDLPRVQYALRVTESVLAALGAVHAGGLLHLDISGGNVVWAGQEPRTGRGCAAFLTDFGSAAEVSGGVRAAALLSYSPGFAAPELRTPGAATSAPTSAPLRLFIFR